MHRLISTNVVHIDGINRLTHDLADIVSNDDTATKAGGLAVALYNLLHA